jgi:glycosyltransferase involved in cell wall biosynthesis
MDKTENTLNKRVFIVWARYHRRSELLAQHLNAAIHYIYHGKARQPLQAPMRYLVQAWHTWRILRQEQPDIIFVQNPPIFAVLVAFLYARYYGARYVIDSHTGAFLGPRWRWSVGLHRLLSNRALVTLVHNKSQEKIVKDWGCRYYVLEDPVGSYPPGESFVFDGQFNAMVVSSFEADEPLDVVFDAAAEIPNVTFYVTGDYRHCAPTLLKRKPENCRLTGYISNQQYVGLLRGADVVIDLVNNSDTLLCGAFEAVSVGTPLIVSDWPVLRDCFPIGTVHVPNTVEGVSEGIRRALREQAQLRNEILLLREQHQIEWMRKFTELQYLVDNN